MKRRWWGQWRDNNKDKGDNNERETVERQEGSLKGQGNGLQFSYPGDLSYFLAMTGLYIWSYPTLRKGLKLKWQGKRLYEGKGETGKWRESGTNRITDDITHDEALLKGRWTEKGRKGKSPRGNSMAQVQIVETQSRHDQKWRDWGRMRGCEKGEVHDMTRGTQMQIVEAWVSLQWPPKFSQLINFQTLRYQCCSYLTYQGAHHCSSPWLDMVWHLFSYLMSWLLDLASALRTYDSLELWLLMISTPS